MNRQFLIGALAMPLGLLDCVACGQGPEPARFSLSVSIDSWHPGDTQASGQVTNPTAKPCWMSNIWLDYGYTNPGTSVVAGADARPALGPNASARWRGRLYPPIPGGSPKFSVDAGCVKPSVRDLGIMSPRNSNIDAVAIRGDQVYISQNNLVFLPRYYGPSPHDVVIAGKYETLNRPEGVTFSGDSFYVADTGNNKVWVGDVRTAILESGAIYGQRNISVLAGIGAEGFAGDGGAPTQASLNHPSDVAVDPTDGAVYIADTGNNRIRVVDGQQLTIRTVAGTGVPGHSGDGGPAVTATLTAPRALAMLANRRLAIADGVAVRIVDLERGTIESLNIDVTAAAGLASCGEGGVLNVADSHLNRVSIATFGPGEPTVIANAVTVPGAAQLAVSADCSYMVAIDLPTQRAKEIFVDGWNP